MRLFALSILIATALAALPSQAQTDQNSPCGFAPLERSTADAFYKRLVDGWQEDRKKIASTGQTIIERRGAILKVTPERGDALTFTDNTDFCSYAYNHEEAGRLFSFDAYHARNGLVSITYFAHEVNGSFLIRLSDGTKTEIADGGQSIESPDGQWIAVLETGMGIADISFWRPGPHPMRRTQKIDGVIDARFVSPTRLEIKYADWYKPRASYDGAIELRGGAWVETSPAPK
jgi:hypothetical protein